MKTNEGITCSFRVFAGTLALLALILLFTSCGGSKSEQGQPPGAGSTAERVVPIQAQAVSPAPFTAMLLLTGTIKAVEDVIVSTEEGGVLKQWKFQKGDAVKRGDVLAVFNDDIIRPMYESADAQYRIAEMNYSKQQKVFEEAGISEIQVLTSQYQRDAARAQAELAKARLDRTRMKTTISGILDERRYNEGELAPPGAPVARVVNLDQVKLLVSVPENYAGAVRTGTSVEVNVTALPGETFKGHVTFVSASVQPDNRTVTVEALLRNTTRKLKPDMIARAKIVESVQRQSILVDESLVQQVDQRTMIVYVLESGKARRRTVTLGSRNDSKVEIVSGLKSGDMLITSGTQNLYDGVPVEVKQ